MIFFGNLNGLGFNTFVEVGGVTLSPLTRVRGETSLALRNETAALL